MVLLWLLPFREQELIIRPLMIWHSLICTYPIAGLSALRVCLRIDWSKGPRMSLCLFHVHRGTVWLLLLECENCNIWVHLINTEWIFKKTPSLVRDLTLTYCTAQCFQQREASLKCELKDSVFISCYSFMKLHWSFQSTSSLWSRLNLLTTVHDQVIT